MCHGFIILAHYDYVVIGFLWGKECNVIIVFTVMPYCMIGYIGLFSPNLI